MDWWIAPGPDELAERAADEIARAANQAPTMAMALATGQTPVATYRRLVDLRATRPDRFAQATFFALDEYVGLAEGDPRSFASYLRRHFIGPMGVPAEHFLAPTSSPWPPGADQAARTAALADECNRYERAIAAAGGLGLAVLGLGTNGHIAFNEPGSAIGSRTRVVTLTGATREANAGAFGQSAQVPGQAITMGIGTILEARQILVLVTGRAKRAIVERLRDGRFDPDLPASALRQHDRVLVLADRAAAP